MDRQPTHLSETEPQNKEQQYLELCGGRPEALFVLAGGVVEKGKRFGSGSYADVDSHGLLAGDKARNIAVAELHQYFPQSLVVTNSHLKREKASNAQISSQQLQKLGVSPEQIIVQENSYSTFTEMVELIRLISQKGWKHAVVVTNEFQIPRAQAMLEHINELHDPNGYWQKPEVLEALEKFKQIQADVKITFVAAEDVLPLRDPRFREIIVQAKNSAAWKKRETMEQRGAREIQTGEYWKRPPETIVKQ